MGLRAHAHRPAMSAILRPFILIARAIRAFFRADLQIRRGGDGLRVVLDEPPPRRVVARQQRQAAEQDKAARELEAMRRSLARLLDESPRNRSAMRYLAFVEHGLKKKGQGALHKMPYDALKRAFEQLEGMVTNWSDVGLATLRSKMAVALMEREPEVADVPAPGPATPSTQGDALETAPLALPVALEGDDAVEAEAALRAAYGEVALGGLELAPEPEEPPVSMHGELASPSAKALARAARRPSEATA